jgi:N6-adenosine-specific RNA methylase IME4
MHTCKFFRKLIVRSTRSARTARTARNTRKTRRILGLSVDRLCTANCMYSMKLANTMNKSGGTSERANERTHD